MKLIILLICLILQALLNVDAKKNKYKFIDRYAATLKPILARFNIDSGLPALIGLLVPAIIIMLLLNLLFSRVAFFYLIYGVIILFLCLDLRDMKKQLKEYFAAITAENLAKAQHEAEEFVGHPVHQNKGEMSRTVTEAIFTKSLTNVFGVIFWFMLLGPIGAVLYYLTAAITERAQRPDFGFSDTYSSAEYFKEILDWFPVRILTFTFALVGHFAPVFGIWLDRIGAGLLENRQFLIDAGLTAIHADFDATHASLIENQQALQLMSRTLWTWVIIITAFNIVIWL